MARAASVGRAKKLLRFGLYTQAANLLSEALRNNPLDVQAHRDLAQVRVAQGRKDWADSLLRRAAFIEQQAFDALEREDVEVQVSEEDSDLAYARDRVERLEAGSGDFSDDHDPLTTTVGDSSPLEQTAKPTPDEKKKIILGSAGLDPNATAIAPKSHWASPASPTDQHCLPAPSKLQLQLHLADISAPAFRAFTGSIGPAVSPESEGFDNADDTQAEDPWGAIELDDELDLPLELDGSEFFNWAEIDASFGEDETDALEAAEEDIEQPALRLDLYRRAEQIALELLQEAGRLNGAQREVEADLRALANILLDRALEARRPALSLGAQKKHLSRLLQDDIAIEALTAAHACRQAWSENPEFHIQLPDYVPGASWMRTQAAAEQIPWNTALRLAALLASSDIEEFRHFFFSMHERWSESGKLQHFFPSFQGYVQYRARLTGCVLDQHPFHVFDEPEELFGLESWEDDPVLGSEFRRELELSGLTAGYRRQALDGPFRPAKLKKEQHAEQTKSNDTP